MKTYNVNYDLGNPNRNYDGVFQAIKSCSNGFCRPTKSQWIINSSSTTAQIRDTISPFLDAGDKLFVAEVGNDWATWAIDKEITDWLKNNWRSACKV
jgi:hypothetical protein